MQFAKPKFNSLFWPTVHQNITYPLMLLLFWNASPIENWSSTRFSIYHLIRPTPLTIIISIWLTWHIVKKVKVYTRVLDKKNDYNSCEASFCMHGNFVFQFHIKMTYFLTWRIANADLIIMQNATHLKIQKYLPIF